ncbi:MAG: prepilin-type N-terminal cleavage/methylation domain-containing protein [Candidatus Falkowbacteria bacterium]
MKKKAFTLIELLIVIAIIGLLATLSVIALNNARAKSRDAKRVADVKQMQTALELFFNDAQRYPTTNEIATSPTIAYGSNVYMSIIPTPPTPPAAHVEYTYTSNDINTYTLQYFLEGPVGSIPEGLNTATNSSLR